MTLEPVHMHKISELAKRIDRSFESEESKTAVDIYSLLENLTLDGKVILKAVDRLFRGVVRTELMAQGEKNLLKGLPFSRAMEETGLFSVGSIEAFVVGEKTGELESSLENLANYFERTSQEKMEGLISMIEPTLTIGIGLAVGLLAIAVIAPIYSLSGGLP